MRKTRLDLLLEDYTKLVEGYVSKAASNETDRSKAQKDYEFELSNGPVKSVYYRSLAKSFNVNVGSLDLENLHKAFDQYYEDNNLLDLFDNNGKLKDRGTYAQIKVLDKKVPAVKALLKLWGAQFSHDMEFLEDKLAKQRAQQLEQQQKSDYAAAKKSEIERLTRIITDEIEQSAAWQQYKNSLAEEEKSVCKLDIQIHEVSVAASHYVFRPSSIGITVFNVTSNKENFWAFHSCKTYSESEEEQYLQGIKADIDDAVTKFLQTLPEQETVSLVGNYTRQSWDVFETTPFYTKIKPTQTYGGYSGLDDKKIYFLDINSNKIYLANICVFHKCMREETSIGKETYRGLILTDVDNPKSTSTKFTTDLVPIALDNGTYSSDGRCYSHTSHSIYFKSEFQELLRTRCNISFQEQNGGNGEWSRHVVDDNSYEPFLDKEYSNEYELDSGD